MTTACIYGFKKNEKEKLTMCGHSGYYEGVGQEIINFIKSLNDIDELNCIYDKIIMLGIEEYENTFYCLESEERIPIESYEDMEAELKATEGDLTYYIEDRCHMIDKSFYCDYGLGDYTYIIDLDKNVLTVKEGYDKNDEDYTIEDIDLGYIFENHIDLKQYMDDVKKEKIVICCCDCCDEAKYKFNDVEYCSECLKEALEESNEEKITIYKI